MDFFLYNSHESLSTDNNHRGHKKFMHTVLKIVFVPIFIFFSQETEAKIRN